MKAEELTNDFRVKECIYGINGLKESDVANLSLLIESKLLLIKSNLEKYKPRDIIMEVHKSTMDYITRSILKNKECE